MLFQLSISKVLFVCGFVVGFFIAVVLGFFFTDGHLLAEVEYCKCYQMQITITWVFCKT